MADAPRGLTRQDREKVARMSYGALVGTRTTLGHRSRYVGGLNRREKALLTLVERQINVLKPGSVPAAAPRAATAAAGRSSGS